MVADELALLDLSNQRASAVAASDQTRKCEAPVAVPPSLPVVSSSHHILYLEPQFFGHRLREGWLTPPIEGLPLPDSELKKRTLTSLYNQRPTWLVNAHDALDAAVYAAYGWPADIGDAEILARLLELNLAREPA